MGKRNNDGFFIILIVIAAVLFIIGKIAGMIIDFVKNLFNSIVFIMSNFFIFIVNNILTIACGVIIILSLILLIKQRLSKRKIYNHPKIKKPQKMPVKKIEKNRHPLHGILEHMVKGHDVDVFQDIQKCRGLLKDYSKNEYKNEVEILSILINDNIPYKLMRYNGKYYYGTLIKKIYKENYSASKYENEYKDIISLLIDFLSEQELLQINILPEDDKPILKFKKYCQETAPFIKHYTYMACFVCRNNYRVIVPVIFLMASLLLMVLSISFNLKIFDDISYNIHKDYSYQDDDQIEIVRTYAYVSSYGLNLRSGPSLSSPIIMQLKQNDKVEIISTVEAWSLVLFDTYEGYVDSAHLSNNQTPVQIRQTQP
jgi:hypothetical protein